MWPLSAVLSIACTGPGNDPEPDQTQVHPPNVLLITWDTMRADHVDAEVTPHLHALASEGVAFSQARTPAPITLPAHASLFTARFPHTHGARNNGTYILADDELTLAEALSGQGYSTGAFVSSVPVVRATGLAQGFDVYDDSLPPETGGHRVGAQTVDAASAWISAQEGPWFAWVHLFDPHRPWNPPLDHAERFPDDLYRASIHYTDAHTKRLLDAVGDAVDDTLLVITADHGEGLGEHGEQTHALLAYDSTLRVPLVMVPGAKLPQFSPGVRDEPVSLVDVAPTIVGALGLPSLPAAEGRNLEPALSAGGAIAATEHPVETVYAAELLGTHPIFGVIDKEQRAWFDLPTRELYDLVEDPGQRKNLFDPTHADAFEAVMARHPRELSTPNASGADPRLVALGYVVDDSVEATGESPLDLLKLLEFICTPYEFARRPQEVVEMAERLETQFGQRAALTDRMVSAYDDLGERRAALALLEARVDNHPDHAEEVSRRKRERQEKQQLLQAIDRALQGDPDAQEAVADYASVAHWLERWDEAEVFYRRALSLQPGDHRSALGLAKLLLSRQRLEEAVALLETQAAVDGYPPDVDCLISVSLAVAADDPQRARPWARKCAERGYPTTRDVAAAVVPVPSPSRE